jgi:hypothetical protein
MPGHVLGAAAQACEPGARAASAAPGPRPEAAGTGERQRQKSQPRCRSGSPATKPSGPGAKLPPPEHTQPIPAPPCVTGGFACLEIWHQGQEPSGAIWALPMWAPGQIEGMRVGGVSAEEATGPHSQRKTTAVRSKTQSPTRTAVSHVQRLGKSMSGCSQFSKCCKTKQAFTGLILQPRGL